jgi:hypothetical protein
MRDTNGLRKFVNERSQARGTGGGRKRQITGRARLESEAAKFARCAKCGQFRWLHEQIYGLVPDHDFVK